MPLQEACVLTLCRLAKLVNAPELKVPELIKLPCRASDEEEKNIILLRLVEYLGHTNPYVCAVAYNEVCVLPGQCFVLAIYSSWKPHGVVEAPPFGDGKLTILSSCPSLLRNSH